jgi:hypothetical protein
MQAKQDVWQRGLRAWRECSGDGCAVWRWTKLMKHPIPMIQCQLKSSFFAHDVTFSNCCALRFGLFEIGTV